MGGRAAIEAVKSIQVDLHIVDPSFEVDGTYRAERPGRMRIDALMGGRHVLRKPLTDSMDGSGAAKATRRPRQKATAALYHGVELPGKLFGYMNSKNAVIATRVDRTREG
jgi:hypothetical protein